MRTRFALTIAIAMPLLGLGLLQASAEDKAECAVEYVRTACPGQEAESYKKCDGKPSCTKLVAADSAEKCQEAALAACPNDRLTVTKSKVVHAKFKGKNLKSKSGKDDFCADYAKRATEFDQCTKK